MRALFFLAWLLVFPGCPSHKLSHVADIVESPRIELCAITYSKKLPASEKGGNRGKKRAACLSPSETWKNEKHQTLPEEASPKTYT